MTKFRRCRLAKERAGARLLRVWVAEPRRPKFVAEAARQAQLLRDRPEQKDAPTFIADFSRPER